MKETCNENEGKRGKERNLRTRKGAKIRRPAKALQDVNNSF